ncbi:UDP-glucose 4-epimerase GalE [Rheinheimera nanhaiensis]|uniref:UDP-glucose 4-epimerase n=1 Tax=Rheinheimera nanhaiensis E407-8 TaxID=562729 RepID=I1DX37_9GAMM|nr:UDP-glucose 4-epimerase GalE [Rheinheimera nanhaiensis]GAB58615.1 UDP-glucose 4-epimerase [Rheinheimera nanhaiensis E407-8]
MGYILLTGGAGYIGSHTALELLNAGFSVLSFDNFSNSSAEALNRVQQLTGKNLISIQGDIRDEAALRQLFSQYAISAVVHFAGLKAVGESTQLPLHYYDNNVAGTVTLCRVMRDFGVKKLVFSSSATVYGDAKQVPIPETAPRSATNPYGQSKLMIEHILEDLVKAEPDWGITLLRYFNPVGAHDSGRIGEDPSGIPNNLMPFISQVAVGKRASLSVFGNDYPTHDGTGVRDYIHVVDLARGHVKALQYLQHNTGIEAINLGTGTGYSVLDMVNAFSRVNAVSVPFTIAPRRPGDIATCYAQPGKAKALLGWQAEKTLDDMVRDSWRWQQANPNGYSR